MQPSVEGRQNKALDGEKSTEHWLRLLGCLFLAQMVLGALCWGLLSTWRGQPVDVSGWRRSGWRPW